jgi:hypothetical protein
MLVEAVGAALEAKAQQTMVFPVRVFLPALRDLLSQGRKVVEPLMVFTL